MTWTGSNTSWRHTQCPAQALPKTPPPTPTPLMDYPPSVGSVNLCWPVGWTAIGLGLSQPGADNEWVCIIRVCVCVCWMCQENMCYESIRLDHHGVDKGLVPRSLGWGWLACVAATWPLPHPHLTHTHTLTSIPSARHFRLIVLATATAGWGLRRGQSRCVCISVSWRVCVAVWWDWLVPLAPVI